MALCVEAGGRLNEQFLKLIDYFASVCGSTEAERRAFTIFPAAYPPSFSTWSRTTHPGPGADSRWTRLHLPTPPLSPDLNVRHTRTSHLTPQHWFLCH